MHARKDKPVKCLPLDESGHALSEWNGHRLRGPLSNSYLGIELDSESWGCCQDACLFLRRSHQTPLSNSPDPSRHARQQRSVLSKCSKTLLAPALPTHTKMSRLLIVGVR